MSPTDRIVVVVGPTASGKSDLAIALTQRLAAAEIVNADSMQLYRGMDIGTAKSPSVSRGSVTHHLLDVLDVAEEGSVAEFQRSARAVIADCLGRGVTPVVVGGSSLYVRAVIDPLDFPGTDADVRARWAAELEARGAAALHTVLAERDPEAAGQILPSNGRRIVRALEVGELTGEPFVASMPPYDSIYPGLIMIGLGVPRDVLDARLERRVDDMWEHGLVDEVRALVERGLADGPTASRALGYQQILAHLRGDMTEAEARVATVVGTRRFARRQDRLFRKDPRIQWLPFDAPDLAETAEQLAARRLEA
ncbi:MAG: tRNA (adenosine(37)-N6)-dimethylallyltransferase MiaA [Aeromicrobium sp.]